jgi:hypothetical protein
MKGISDEPVPNLEQQSLQNHRSSGFEGFFIV